MKTIQATLWTILWFLIGLGKWIIDWIGTLNVIKDTNSALVLLNSIYNSLPTWLPPGLFVLALLAYVYWLFRGKDANEGTDAQEQSDRPLTQLTAGDTYNNTGNNFGHMGPIDHTKGNGDFHGR